VVAGVGSGVALSVLVFRVAMAAHSASNGSSRMDLLTSACHASWLLDWVLLVDVGLL